MFQRPPTAGFPVPYSCSKKSRTQSVIGCLLYRLFRILKLVQPNRDLPAYRFGQYYYCENARWFEGARHNLIGHKTCRVAQIDCGNTTEPSRIEECLCLAE